MNQSRSLAALRSLPTLYLSFSSTAARNLTLSSPSEPLSAAASASHLSLALLATQGHDLRFLTLSICVENFAGGFAGTALIAFMSTLTSPLYAAAQYALLSSLYALPGKLLGGFSGFAVAHFGYPVFFVGTSCIGIPVALICLAVWRTDARLAREADLPQAAEHGKIGST